MFDNVFAPLTIRRKKKALLENYHRMGFETNFLIFWEKCPGEPSSRGSM